MIIHDFSNNLPENYRLFLWGDTHIGNGATSYDAINEFVNEVKKYKNVFWASGGDQIEAISVTDKRFDIDTHGKSGRVLKLKEQVNAFVNLFSPIADKGLWILDGNHEYKYINLWNLTEDMADKLNMIYGTYTIRANMGNYKILDWHGWGSVNSRAGDKKQRETNEAIKKKRKMRDMAPDCLINVMHHIHKARIHRPDPEFVIIENRGHLQQEYVTSSPIQYKNISYYPEEMRWYASSGSALRTFALGHSAYSERFGYPPTELAYIEVIVKKGFPADIKKKVLQKRRRL